MEEIYHGDVAKKHHYELLQNCIDIFDKQIRELTTNRALVLSQQQELLSNGNSAIYSIPDPERSFNRLNERQECTRDINIFSNMGFHADPTKHQQGGTLPAGWASADPQLKDDFLRIAKPLCDLIGKNGVDDAAVKACNEVKKLENDKHKMLIRGALIHLLGKDYTRLNKGNRLNNGIMQEEKIYIVHS